MCTGKVPAIGRFDVRDYPEHGRDMLFVGTYDVCEDCQRDVLNILKGR
jgi:hypothetical protein